MRGLILVLLILIAGVGCLQPTQSFAQFPEVIWDREGVTPNAHFGGIIWPLGDQNDDGHDDWSVLSGGTFLGGEHVEFRIDLFHGGNPPSLNPYMSYLVDVDSIRDIRGGQAIGDVNGDGYLDWIVEISYQAIPDSYAVNLYYGGPESDQIPDFSFNITFDWHIIPWGGRSGCCFDFNGDGYDDIVVFEGFPVSAGFILFGSEEIDSVPDWYFPETPSGYYLASPTSYGDINGDHYDDIIMNDIGTNVFGAHIFLGGSNPDTLADFLFEGFDVVPSTLTVDINGDEHDDLVVGFSSSVYVYWGSPVFDTDVDVTLNFPGCEGNGPSQLSSGGDFNNDGCEDLTVIGKSCVLGWGKLCFYLGGRWINVPPAFIIDGRTPPLDLVGISAAAGVGDINNDGLEDLAIGATNDNNDGRRGRVVILSGDPNFVVPAAEFILDPFSFLLHPCYPNPFNPATTISFDLAHPGMVKLEVFDITGRQVSTLIEESLPAGSHRAEFNAASLASGLHFCTLQSGGQTQTQKLILLK